MPKTIGTLVLAAALFVPLTAQSGLDAGLVERIRREAEDRSQVMHSVHVLSDVYGPRLTGTPNLEAAGRWAVRTMESWGLVNGRLEPWDWGQPGWTNDRFTAHIVSPVRDQLTAEVLAWTPGTNGVVRARAFHLVVPDRPTASDLTNYFERIRGEVRGGIILVGASVRVPVNLNPPAKRRVDQFLKTAGARVRVNDAGREHGQITAFGSATADVIPTIILRNEDYGRIARILADGTRVDLEIEIANTFYPDGKTAYNAIAEIPGTDRRDEVVMLGGHLDSWHAATGATDNAVGCATMMEAVRILSALGVRPRRTIRVALWSGEEQGLLGSQAYVKEHFGTYEQPKPDFMKLAAYFNMDTGTGRLRGASVFGPPEAATILRTALAPFADLGFAGVIATTSRALGGTDSTSFNNAGLPGIGFSQDPIEYNSHTHHTNLDTYERVLEADVKSAAAVVAAAVYAVAMADTVLPRLTGGAMPAPVTR
jgi:hypothetical protein